MKPKPIEFPQRYAAALRRHLKSGVTASLRPALTLGRRAAALGLTAPDLTRIHKKAIALILLASKSKKTLRNRAALFLNEALVPISETHVAARRGNAKKPRLKEKQSRPNPGRAADNSPLHRGTGRRKNDEAAPKRSGDYHHRLLNDSMELQEDMRQLAHKALTVQENERRTISCELRNEIAQTLLGIQVRLLALKKIAGGTSANLTKEVASTRRLVRESLQSINRFARLLGNRGQT